MSKRVSRFLSSNKGVILQVFLLMGIQVLSSTSGLPFGSELDKWLVDIKTMAAWITGIAIIVTVLMMVQGGGNKVAMTGGGIILGGLIIANIDWVMGMVGLGGVCF